MLENTPSPINIVKKNISLIRDGRRAAAAVLKPNRVCTLSRNKKNQKLCNR